MRTKTLLGLAALAAGAVTAMAQSNVYSLNIVGYCNVPLPSGFTFQSNPLDNGNNAAGTVIPNPTGQWDGLEIHEWTGASFNVSVFDSSTDDTTTGFMNRNGTAPVPAPILSSGKGYLLNNPGVSNNITYVGNVRGPGTNTLTFPGRTAPYAVGSTLPIAGNPFQIGFSNPAPAGPLDGVLIEKLTTTPSGAASGFFVSVFDSSTDDTTTGFMDRNGTAPVPAPIISIGQGFFLANPNASPVTWTQILTNSP